MKVSSRQRTHHIYIAEMFRYHVSVLKRVMDTPEFNNRFMFAKGNVANDLFRSTAEVRTGLITKEAYDLLNGEIKYTATREHIMSRNRAAEHILRRMLKYETSDERLLNMIIAACRTVYSTKNENKILEQERKKLQSDAGRCISPWRKLYSTLGLLSYPKRRPTISVIVDGQLYKTVNEAAAHFSLTSMEVRRRCKSTSKKWKDWKESQITNE